MLRSVTVALAVSFSIIASAAAAKGGGGGPDHHDTPGPSQAHQNHPDHRSTADHNRGDRDHHDGHTHRRPGNDVASGDDDEDQGSACLRHASRRGTTMFAPHETCKNPR